MRFIGVKVGVMPVVGIIRFVVDCDLLGNEVGFGNCERLLNINKYLSSFILFIRSMKPSKSGIIIWAVLYLGFFLLSFSLLIPLSIL